MAEKDCEQCVPQSSSCCYSYLNGYFGKPTKLRTSQPSMFQILTWNQASPTPEQLKVNEVERRQCCNCNCESRKYNENNYHENSKINQKMPTPSAVTNKSIKKITQQDLRRKESPKGRQQYSHNLKYQKDQILDKPDNLKPQKIQQRNYSNAQVRPKSAEPIPRKVKELASPPKSPKFATNLNKSEVIVQQEPVQTKQKLIQKFKQTTRWIPNSAFTTYFGKPAFQNYGRGNTNPSYGGLMYGNYLKSHNIQPHRGINSPKNIQSYNVALMKGQQIGAVYPYPPKAHKIEASAAQQIKNSNEEMHSSQIYPQQNNFRSFPICPPNLYELEKFGGKGIQKVSQSRLQRSTFEKQNEYAHNDHEKETINTRMASQKRYGY